MAGREPEPRELQGLADFLRAGGVLAHPTSTVYGLGGILLPEVERAIAGLKGRSVSAAPFILIVADVATVIRALPAVHWDERADRIADAFWPGPVTVVLPDGSPHGVAVRVEGHPVVRRLLRELGLPMSSTSLNRVGGAPAVTAAEARRVLAHMPAVEAPVRLLSAGDLQGAPPSSVVSLREPEPRVLREGAVPAERLLACLGGRPGP